MERSEDLPNWARNLFEQLKLAPGSGVEEVFLASRDLANNIAPGSRKIRTGLVFLQGAAILAPLFWLIIVRERWDATFTAYTVVACIVLVVAISWWLRWRGMQHAWARTRVIVEIARSERIVSSVAPGATVRALNIAPDLQKIARWMSSDGGGGANLSLEEKRNRYFEERIRHQLNYYRDKSEDARKQRRRLARIVTLALDAALFLAVAGLLISLRERASDWLDWSYSDYLLGFFGAALPLAAVLAQLRGSYLDLDRRVGRYEQQIDFLELQVEKEGAITTGADLEETVEEVERALLGEVVEWFYVTETAQPYYRSKQRDARAEKREISIAAARSGWVQTIFAKFLHGAGFLAGVIFTRVLVVVLSVLVTTALINYRRAPEDPEIQSVLRSDDGGLYSPVANQPYQLWNPLPERAGKGFILISHGLRDKVDLKAGGEHWMTAMECAMREKLGAGVPDICLVDWRRAAKPSADPSFPLDSVALKAMGFPEDAIDMLNNLAMIRPQGERIGELVGFKLARAIRSGKLRRDRPMHFIGHSAGGFVVLHAALVLEDLGLAPEELRITLLDTPLPVADDLRRIAEVHQVDFYCTSRFAQGVPAEGFTPKFRRIDRTPPAEVDAFLGAHSWAHEWYIRTILDASEESGFSLSPFGKSD